MGKKARADKDAPEKADATHKRKKEKKTRGSEAESEPEPSPAKPVKRKRTAGGEEAADQQERSEAGLKDAEDAKASPEPPPEPAALPIFGASLGPSLKEKRGKEKPDTPEASAAVLPAWMKRGRVVRDDVRVPVAEAAAALRLDARIVATLASLGIDALFEVQEAVTRAVLEDGYGGDVCVSAPTGSGKTLAYVLPIVQSLAGRATQRLRALCIVPTRDLALQVASVFRPFCEALSLTVEVAVGGIPFPEEQRRLLAPHGRGVDVVVCTPGRLMDHLRPSSGAGAGAGAHFAVLTAFPNPPPVRKLLFSATLSKNPQKVASLRLLYPRFFAATATGKYRTPIQLAEYLAVCEAGEKPLVLIHLLRTNDFRSTIVFTHSVESSHRLYKLLELYGGFKVAEYSSLLPQKERTAILGRFRAGDDVNVLVCSDAMARGIDVAGIEAVVNYDAPAHIKTYIHRAGRTARAGRPGATFSILRHPEVRHFKEMLQKAERVHEGVRPFKVEKGALEGLVPRYVEALAELKAALEAEKGRGGAPHA